MALKRKNGFLTPNAPPDDLLCRSFSIPNSAEWLGNFMGALYELTEAQNWEKFGDLTPEEAADAYMALISDVLPGVLGQCELCVLPGGSPLFRIGRFGRIEQLAGDEWTEPQGTYELPPTPPRTEPTPDERRCLAAANAANAFEQLYEEISDAFNAGMSFQEWTEALVAALITLLGTVFGLVIAPLIVIGVAIVGIVYEVLEFVGADVWDAAFTEMLVCLLYECSTDTGDVVTFDYDCFMNNLASVTDIFDPSFAQIRLFGQISYIMQIIGSQSLDAMGATTEIESADCSECEDGWCRLYDFTLDPYQFEPQEGAGTFLSEWIEGVGFKTVYVPTGGNGYTISAIAAPFAATIQNIEIGFTYTQGSCFASGDAALDVSSQGFANRFMTTLVCDVPASPDEFCYDSLDPAVPVTVTQLLAQLIAGVTSDDSDPGGEAVIQYLKIQGIGTAPPLGEFCEWNDCAAP